MGSRERAVDIGAARARETIARIMAEARAARLAAGLGQDDVATALGISRSQYSRMERGLSPEISIDLAARLFAVLGQDLSVRAFPAGDPIRDAAHAALLERLHARCHRSFGGERKCHFPTQATSGPGMRRPFARPAGSASKPKLACATSKLWTVG